MAATASLDDYIKLFKQDYKKFLASDTGSVSSIDTEELLSDISSETSSKDSRPLPKGSIKSLSSVKQRSKKPKVSQPTHLKPLHSTPLKMIQEEEEFYDSQHKLSDYLPGQQFNIDEYLPRARAAKNKKVEEIFATLDIESENMSILSSVDTEFLLQSSDEEDYTPKTQNSQTKTKLNSQKPEVNNISNKKTLKTSEKQEFTDFSTYSKSKSSSLSLSKSQVVSIIPRRLSTETLSLSVGSSKKTGFSNKPSAFFNSVVPNVQKPVKTLRLCTCIISGSIYSHFSNCSPVTVNAEIGSYKILPKKPRLSLLSGVILIQRNIRKFLSKKYAKTKKNIKVNENVDIGGGSRTLNDAFRELEALKVLASDKSSEVSRDYSQKKFNLNLDFKGCLDNLDYQPSEVDTEELLNSSFSSILSRN